MSNATHWQTAHETVLKGTTITAGSSAFVTGIYQIFKKHPQYGQLSAIAALNSAMTAVTFFSIREYLVSPILISTIPALPYERRRASIGWNAPTESFPEPTWTEMRTQYVADSWASGTLTGGVLRGLLAGRRAVLPAALTGGVACALLQLLYNEVQVMRVTYVGQQQRQDPSTILPKEKSALFPRFLKLFGLSEYSDEEFLTKLKSQRDGHLAKIRKLEEEIEAENKK